MRHGVRAGIPLGTLPCTMLASMGQITSFSKKKPKFLGNHSKFVGNAVKARACNSPPWHAAKAKATPMGTQPRPRHAREANFRPARTGVWGGNVRDTQADVPSAEWLRAQLAFKNSMIRGILQFAPSIAFRYLLHQCESLDIRCRESF